MANDYRTFEAQYRRRDLLLILYAAADFSCNESLLRTMLRQQGYLVSTTQLRDDFEVLQRLQLVEVREIAEIQIVELLVRGRDVAEGAEVAEGIARPEPRRA